MLSRPLGPAWRGWKTYGHGVLGLVLLTSVAGALTIALLLLFHGRWKLCATFTTFLLVMFVCGVLFWRGHIFFTTALYHGVSLVGIIALMAFSGGITSVVLPVIPVCVMSCFAILPRHSEQIGTTLAAGFILAYCLLLLVPAEWNELEPQIIPNLRVIMLAFSVVSAVLVSVHSQKRSRMKKKIALEAALLAAERAEHTKNALIANISHELRTPINAALGAAELIPLEPANSEEYAQVIRNACSSLLIVINDVLMYSSLEKATLTIEQAPVNLEQMLWDVLRVMMPLATNISLEITVSPEASALLRRYELIGDIVRVQQIIANLVNNAIKFTPQGQVLVMLQEGNPAEESKAEKGQRDEDQPLVGLNKKSSPPVAPSRVWLTFLVKDTGIGIAKHKLQHIFDPFTQADEGVSRMYGGTGLGLSISRKLAHAMGGELTVESAPDEGSTFRVSLPFQANLRNLGTLTDSSRISKSSLVVDAPMVHTSRAKIADSTPSTPDLSFRPVCVLASTVTPDLRSGLSDPPTPEKNSSLEPSRAEPISPPVAKPQLAKLSGLVLLVDDTPINLKIVGRLLERLGMTVLTATNGFQAVELAKERGREIVVILMDVQMPICDGLTATRAIRALGQQKEYSFLAHLPIIALTANAMDSNRDDTAKAGMTGFLAKPVNLGILEAAMAPLAKDQTSQLPTPIMSISIDTMGVERKLTPLVIANAGSVERKSIPLVPLSPVRAPSERKVSISETLATTPPHSSQRRQSKKLPIVILAEEDFKESRVVLRKMGFSVLAVANGPDAVDLAMKHGANAVALLIGVDVVHVTRSIRTASQATELRFLRDLPIIQLGESKATPAEGVSGFLSNPFSPDALEAVLVPLVGRPRECHIEIV